MSYETETDVPLYTELATHEVSQLGKQYGLAVSEHEPLASGHFSTNYLLQTDRGQYVLSLLHGCDDAHAQTIARVEDYVGKHGISAPKPLLTSDSALITHHHDAPVLVKHYLPGSVPTTLSYPEARQLGAVLARLHLLRPARNICSRHADRRLSAAERLLIGSFADREFVSWLYTTFSACEYVTELALPTALTHGDVFPDNTAIAADGALSLLEWQNASMDLPVLDLGMALVGSCRDHGVFEPSLAKLLIQGYESVRPLSVLEHDVLGDAAIYSAALIAFLRYQRYHVNYHDPAKHHLYQEMPSIAEQISELWSSVR